MGNKAAIEVRIYADHSALDNPKGTLVFAGKTDLDNEPACMARHGYVVAQW